MNSKLEDGQRAEAVIREVVSWKMREMDKHRTAERVVEKLRECLDQVNGAYRLELSLLIDEYDNAVAGKKP